MLDLLQYGLFILRMLSELPHVLLLLALIPIDESIQPLQLSLRQFGLSTQQLFLHLQLFEPLVLL